MWPIDQLYIELGVRAFNDYVDRMRWVIRKCPFLSRVKKVYLEVRRGGGIRKGSSYVHVVLECPLLSENIWVVPSVKKLLLVPL